MSESTPKPDINPFPRRGPKPKANPKCIRPVRLYPKVKHDPVNGSAILRDLQRKQQQQRQKQWQRRQQQQQSTLKPRKLPYDLPPSTPIRVDMEIPDFTNPPKSPKLTGDGEASEFVPVGWAVRLTRLDLFSKALGTSVEVARKLLEVLDVPVLDLGDNRIYFNLPVLELALWSLLRQGAPGWTYYPESPKIPDDVHFPAYEVQKPDPLVRDDEKRLLSTLQEQLSVPREMQAVATYYYDFSKRRMLRKLRQITGALRAFRKRRANTHRALRTVPDPEADGC